MTLLKSMIIAFSMYSKIPMPSIQWNEKNMKYSLLFFPLIGVVIGGLLYSWLLLCDWFDLGTLLRASIASIIPVIVSGGIHLDGYIDTMDALHSYQTKEKKLEILKDPHIGAFGLISLVVYYLTYVGVMSEVTDYKVCIIIGIGFVLSRAYSGLALVLFHSAKKDGLLYAFSSTAHRKVIGVSLVGIIILCCGLITMIYLQVGVSLTITTFICFLYYRYISYKEFGGITGDLAGFFLQICELFLIVITVLVDRVMALV